MKTIIQEAALLSKFYKIYLAQDDDNDTDSIELFAAPKLNMIVPDHDYSDMEHGTITIPGMQATQQDSVVGILKEQDDDVLNFTLENHAIRCLYTNFIGVDGEESVTVKKSRGKDFERAGVQKIEVMTMLYYKHVLEDKYGWLHVWEMDLPYRTQGFVQKLYKKYSEVTVSIDIHQQYLEHITDVMSIIQQFEMEVQ